MMEMGFVSIWRFDLVALLSPSEANSRDVVILELLAPIVASFRSRESLFLYTHRILNMDALPKVMRIATMMNSTFGEDTVASDLVLRLTVSASSLRLWLSDGMADLGRNTDESSANFVQSIVVLISTPSQVITKASMEMLEHLMFYSLPKVRISLVKADLIPQLVTTLNPQSLSFTETADIHTYLVDFISRTVRLASQFNLNQLTIEDAYEPQTVHETVLRQVFAPSEKTYLRARLLIPLPHHAGGEDTKAEEESTTTHQTNKSRPQVALRQTDRARIRSLPPACPVVRSVFAIEDDEVEGGRHQAAQTGRIAPRGGIGRGESDKDDEVKEPIPIVLQDIVSNILHLQTAQPDQTALQRQKRKRERRLRNELHTIFKEEEELSTSEEEQRRLAALKKDDDGLLNYNLPSEHPSHRPTPVPSPLNLRVMGLDAISVHPSSQLALSEYLLNQHNAFKPQFTVDRLLSELRHASRSTSAFFFSRVGPLFTHFFPKHRLTLSQQIQRDCIRSEKPNRRGPHNAKTIVKRKDIQLLIWVVILHWLVFARHQHKEEFTGRDNSQMLDEKVETAPSEDEKPKSKASAKLSKSPAKEKKGKEE
ncbi:hypothetical protein BLNAU_12064 [Blattamonas nauphoetae]|uniref:Uncharacterized protein n=1 Tax=Blattamonas nauphoetae TaxID=2049346 RepID=A0ABQ9XNI7_9EUKA|nr:hypothetical protein BLNAU_12064 [Blattamonas nauphoetae]